MFFLGYDIGSSSVKASLIDARDFSVSATVSSPETEMPIDAPHPGWAEQHPDLWWENVVKATHKLLQKAAVSPGDIASIGISYQMHGLVCLDKNGQVLRPSIIWCDSRAVPYGDAALNTLGSEFCLEHYLNAPGNFTASKLKWVRENEPACYERIWKICLPGDYIAYRMSGDLCTTVSGLSEGIFWDFKREKIAADLLDLYGISPSLLADIAPTFGIQGKLREAAAGELGLPAGIPIAYRAGDQPNNAFSLNVLQPGEIAATGGTSGVVYGISDAPVYDPKSRVNGFAHVNHQADQPRIGVLLCINGAGILYSWLRKAMGGASVNYFDMETRAASVPVGANGLVFVPFGNGAERMLENTSPGAQLRHLDFNRHSPAHLIRAALEGIAFSFVYGIDIMKQMNMSPSMLRVGNDNLFQSAVFSQTISTLLGSRIQVLDTTGATGAAIGGAVGAGHAASPEAAFARLQTVKMYEPEANPEVYQKAYSNFLSALQ